MPRGGNNPTGKGGWPKGVSGNPGGRSKRTEEFLRACEDYSKEGFATLVEIARSAQHKDRFPAACKLLAYAHGQPRGEIDLGSGRKVRATFEFVGPDDE